MKIISLYLNVFFLLVSLVNNVITMQVDLLQQEETNADITFLSSDGDKVQLPLSIAQQSPLFAQLLLRHKESSTITVPLTTNALKQTINVLQLAWAAPCNKS